MIAGKYRDPCVLTVFQRNIIYPTRQFGAWRPLAPAPYLRILTAPPLFCSLGIGLLSGVWVTRASGGY